MYTSGTEMRSWEKEVENGDGSCASQLGCQVHEPYGEIKAPSKFSQPPHPVLGSLFHAHEFHRASNWIFEEDCFSLLHVQVR